MSWFHKSWHPDNFHKFEVGDVEEKVVHEDSDTKQLSFLQEKLKSCLKRNDCKEIEDFIILLKKKIAEKKSFGRNRKRSKRKSRKSKRRSKRKSRKSRRIRRRRSRRFGYSHDQGPRMYNAHYSDGILLADNAFAWMGNPEARAENAGSG